MPILWDAVVIGAGPAGLSFATKASELGLKVLAIDEQATPGGQIFRNIENQTPGGLELLGKDYARGSSLIKAFYDSDADYLPNAVVWKIERDGRLCYSSNGVSSEIRAKRIVIATGAMERPVPFEGWTLPGVIGAGAVDTLYKTSGIVPKGPVTMVGNGPLMLSVAAHLKELGVQINYFLETKPTFSTISSAHLIPKALINTAYLLKGVAMLLKAKGSIGNWKQNVTAYSAEGKGRVESLSFSCGSKTEQIKTDSVIVHEGILPRSEFARQVNLEHCWNAVQRYWYPKVDLFGRSSEDNIYIAGDGSFVDGAEAAENKGLLAAIDISADLKQFPQCKKNDLVASVFRAMKRILAPRPFVDAVYRPRKDLYAMDDNTLVCRCEEVTAQQIRSAVIQGMESAEMVKSLTRCGMGPCQGRSCSSGLTELIARETGQLMENLSPISIRPPVRNLSIGEFATMNLINNSGKN